MVHTSYVNVHNNKTNLKYVNKQFYIRVQIIEPVNQCRIRRWQVCGMIKK